VALLAADIDPSKREVFALTHILRSIAGVVTEALLAPSFSRAQRPDEAWP
jgi:hypothetical protein